MKDSLSKLRKIDKSERTEQEKLPRKKEGLEKKPCGQLKPLTNMPNGITSGGSRSRRNSKDESPKCNAPVMLEKVASQEKVTSQEKVQPQEKVQLNQVKQPQVKQPQVKQPQEKEKEVQHVLHKTLPMKKAFTLKDKLNSVNSNPP